MEIYSLFGNGTYFNAATLERGLNEILKIFLPEGANKAGAYDWDGTPLTAAQLWEKYFADDPGILEEYLRAIKKAATEEKPPEIRPESGKGINGDISKPKAGIIKEIEKEVAPPKNRTFTGFLRMPLFLAEICSKGTSRNS